MKLIDHLPKPVKQAAKKWVKERNRNICRIIIIDYEDGDFSYSLIASNINKIVFDEKGIEIKKPNLRGWAKTTF